MRAEEEALRSRKLSTEFEVKRLFYGLLLAFETERITKELISQAESHYNEVKNKYKEGTASRFDLLQSKVQVSKVMPQFVRAKNAEQLIASELKKLLGVNMNDDITLKGSLESSPIEVKEEEFLKTAYANRPELVMKALGMDINRQEIEVARADSMPQVIAGFNYDYRSNDVEDMFNPRHNNWNAGVKVSLSVFDGFAAKAKVDEARVRYAQAKLEKEDLSELIALEVRKACLDITQAESIIASQKDSVDEAKEALKIAEASYDSGVITNLDVLDAQVSLSQIEQNLSGAVYDHIMAKAYLDISMGKSSLTEADNEKR
jgi:outer membrane protein TolC